MGRIAGVSPTETKERLVDAAARVFARKGFEKATVAEIASEAGVSSGAIYTHYSSKAELLADALRGHGDEATSSLFAPGTRLDATGMLVALTERLADPPRAETALLAEALLAARRDDALAKVLADALDQRARVLAGLVAEGQAAGVLQRGISADVAARFALMLGLGSMLVNELNMPPVDQGEWNEFSHRLIGAFSRDASGQPQ